MPFGSPKSGLRYVGPRRRCVTELIRVPSFFFQAEDGIRDYKVTGVQTCALPILETWDPKPDAPAEIRGPLGSIPTKVDGVRFGELLPEQARLADRLAIVRGVNQIGRASCRERV